jgi:hypothetical protein
MPGHVEPVLVVSTSVAWRAMPIRYYALLFVLPLFIPPRFLT